MKSSKKVIIVSLFPFYLMVLSAPLLLMEKCEWFFDYFLGKIILGVALFSYWVFYFLVYPFHQIFENYGLIVDSGGLWASFPVITFLGLLILSCIYFIIIYTFLTFIKKLRE